MIEKMWKKFVNRESIAYIIFGVLTTVTDWVVYTVLRRFGVDYRIATAVSWGAAVLFAFVTNKLFVFRSMEFSARLLWREFTGFVAARAATGIFTEIGMIVMVDGLHWNEFLGKLIVSAVSLVLNYIFSKWFIFKKSDTEDFRKETREAHESAGAEETSGCPGAEETSGCPGAEETSGCPGAEETSGCPGAEETSGCPGAEETSGRGKTEETAGYDGGGGK